MLKQDHYRILDIKHSASDEEIKVAYRRLARKYHPDISKAHNAEEKFKAVNLAYDVLRNADSREEYDRSVDFDSTLNQQRDYYHTQHNGYSTQANSADSSYFKETLNKEEAKQRRSGLGNIFDGLFKSRKNGKQAPQSNGYKTPPKRPSFARKPQPRIADVSLELEDVYHGSKRTIHMPDGKKLNVKIPIGVTDGQKIRLNSKHANESDFYLRVNLKPHRLYTVEGKDLTIKLPLAPWESALGASISVPTLSGAIKLNVPPNSQAGTKLRLADKGLPGSPAGDLYVELEVVIPTPKNDKEHELYNEMKDLFSWNPRELIK